MISPITYSLLPKEDLIVLDVVDNTKKHALATVPSILDLPASLDLQGHPLDEVAARMRELGERFPHLSCPAPSTYEELLTRLQEVDLLAHVRVRPEVAQASRCNWLWTPGGYLLSAGRCPDGVKRSALLSQDALGCWRLSTSGGGPVPDSLGKGALPDFAVADAWVLSRWPQARRLVMSTAPWRSDAPTPRQRRFLSRQGYLKDQLAGMTRGDVSGLISQILAGTR